MIKVMLVSLIPNLFSQRVPPELPPSVSAIDPRNLEWVMNKLISYGIASQGTTIAEILAEQNLDDEQLIICGFVSTTGTDEEKAISLLNTLIPLHKALELFGGDGILDGYTDEQLQEAGMYTLSNLIFAGVTVGETIEYYESATLDLQRYAQGIRSFIDIQISDM